MKVFKVLLCLVLLQSCEGQQPKINGLSLVSSREPINQSHIKPIIDVHANYVAIIPFGFIRDLKQPEVRFNTERQWFGETKDGVTQYTDQLRKENIKVMLKPQIWVWRGQYTGFIEMETEEDWKVFEKTYGSYILEYAKLATELKADIFCIGTELEKFVENRPEYWFDLIEKVKKVYKGKITYAANWDEFKQTPFWEKLNFIGVNAYFPVDTIKTPTINGSRKGWKPHKQLMKEISKKYDRPILFTEFGYRSVDYTAKEPWKSDRSMTSVNLQGQANATQAIFEEFWDEKWFGGGFLWKWFHNHDEVGGVQNSRFTPQNKPAEEIVRRFYKEIR